MASHGRKQRMTSRITNASSAYLQAVDCLPDHQTFSGHLVARCHRWQDRVGHSLWWREASLPSPETSLSPVKALSSPGAGPGEMLILQSQEGEASDPWPLSPPLQEIVAEPLAAGRRPVLLGVGMAGRSHWSATIEGDGMAEAIAMDIACRTAAAPARLGSSYRVPPAWEASLVDERSLHLQHPLGMSVLVEVIGALQLRWTAPQLTLCLPVDAENHHRGQTYRWRYVVRAALTRTGEPGVVS
jgi:hypothetical protein